MIRTVLLLFAISATVFGAQIVVSFDTTSFSTGPHYLDFQLNGADAVLSNNAVSIQNLQTGGGSFDGAATLDGGATGTALTGFNIVDSDPTGFNAVLQQFTAGTQVKFVLDYSLNYTGPGFPDQFTFTILDENQFSIVSEGNGALLTIDLTSGATPQLLPANLDYGGGTVTIEAVPEPATFMLVAPLAGIAFWLRRRTH